MHRLRPEPSGGVHQHLQPGSRRTVRHGRKKDGFGAVGWRKSGAAAPQPVPVHAATARFGIECLPAEFLPEEVGVRRIGEAVNQMLAVLMQSGASLAPTITSRVTSA